MGRKFASADEEFDRLYKRIEALEHALAPFAALVHSGGISAPYPMDEGEWAERFIAAKTVLEEDI